MTTKLGFHPAALIVGALLTAVCFVSMSQIATNSPRIEYGPAPRDYVQILQGQPFTVPMGTVFVPTALGMGGPDELRVNGAVEASFPGTSWLSTYTATLPGCAAYPAGSVIEAVATGGVGATGAQVWGYLAPAHSPSGLPAIRVRYQAPARDFVVIHAGAPFTVPVGRVFLLTAGTPGPGVNGGSVYINGVRVWGSPGAGNYSLSDVVAAPEGCTAGPGAVVSCSYSGSAWGYLGSQ